MPSDGRSRFVRGGNIHAIQATTTGEWLAFSLQARLAEGFLAPCWLARFWNRDNMRCFPGVCANTSNVRRQWKLVHMCWEESRASQKILDRYHVIQQEKHLCHFLGKTFETYPSCKTSTGSRTDPGVARIDRNVRQREALEVFVENCVPLSHYDEWRASQPLSAPGHQ